MNSIYRNDINLNYISMHSKHIQGTATANEIYAMSVDSNLAFNFLCESFRCDAQLAVLEWRAWET